MNHRKFVLVTLLFSLLISPISQVTMVSSQENISPIESVDWLNEDETVTDESDEMEDTTQDEEDVPQDEEDTAEVEDVEESAETQPSVDMETDLVNEVEGESAQTQTMAEILDLDTSNPANFVADLSQLDQKMIEYVTFETVDESLSLVSQNMLKDVDKYYAARLVPPYLPQSLFIIGSEDTIENTYISVDDLIKYAADALNTQPQIYEGSVAEDFYVFSQENIEEIQGTVVEMPSNENVIVDETQYISEIESFVTQVAIEWLSNESVQAAVFETDLGNQVDISGEVGQLFNEIATEVEAEYPELTEFFELFSEGYEGTVTIDYETGLFGVGLLYNLNPNELAGIELYIQGSDAGIIDFSDEIIYTYDEFVELVGFDAIAEIESFEATLTPDMFTTVTE